MKEYKSLSQKKWDCKYYIVFIQKYRRKIVYGKIRARLGEIFQELAKQKKSGLSGL